MIKGQVGDASIRLLRIFKAVVECGGFAAAEVELNISQSAISLAISEIETRFGFKLCQRGRAGFSLTNEGEKVYDYALQLLGAIEEFKSQVNSLHDHLRGELNIGITDNLVSLEKMVITNALGKLQETAKDVIVNIRMKPPKEIEKDVLEGRLHLGVVPEVKHLSGLGYLPLYKESSELYCEKRHPLFNEESVTAKTLRTYPAVIPSYEQTPAIKKIYKKLNEAARASDREGIAFLILTGRYIGFLPTHYAKRWVDSGEMRSICADELNYDTAYTIITRKAAQYNLVLETFLGLLEIE